MSDEFKNHWLNYIVTMICSMKPPNANRLCSVNSNEISFASMPNLTDKSVVCGPRRQWNIFFWRTLIESVHRWKKKTKLISTIQIYVINVYCLVDSGCHAKSEYHNRLTIRSKCWMLTILCWFLEGKANKLQREKKYNKELIAIINGKCRKETDMHH